MKIRLYSDIHNEIRRYYMKNKYTPFIIPELSDDINTVLILAGDIDHAKNIPQYMNSLSDRFLAVIHVAGNHEYYSSNLKSCNEKMRGRDVKLNDNCHHLENDVVVIQGHKFIGCTLWTDLSDPLISNEVQNKMNDYIQIRYGYGEYRKINTLDTTKLNKISMEFIKDNIKDAVVVTHHTPLNVHGSAVTEFNPYSYRFNALDYAYHNELEDFIIEHKPKAWAWGHTHEPVYLDYFGTKLYSNPVGYYGEECNVKHEVIEI